MAPLKHPNLVCLYGAVWNEGPDKLCLVLEFVDNGSLRDVLKLGASGTWATCFPLAHGTAKCLKYLHHGLAETLIHRDLKPENASCKQTLRRKLPLNSFLSNIRIIRCLLELKCNPRQVKFPRSHIK